LVIWLFKVAVFVGVLGLIAIDGISVALGHVRIGDAAAQAASAAAQGYGLNNYKGALGAAESAAAENGATLLPQNFSISGNTVTVTVHGSISTIWLGHVPGTTALLDPTEVATAILQPP
jgi:hypothetical protein